MGLIDRDREPTVGELRVFGLLIAVFGGVVGALVLYRTSSWRAAIAIWSVGLLLCICYYGIPSLRFGIYRAWMILVFPIGWFISHAMLALVYYLVLSPIGLLMRLVGREPLERSLDRTATTYWTPESGKQPAQRYFHQY